MLENERERVTGLWTEEGTQARKRSSPGGGPGNAISGELQKEYATLLEPPGSVVLNILSQRPSRSAHVGEQTPVRFAV